MPLSTVAVKLGNFPSNLQRIRLIPTRAKQ